MTYLEAALAVLRASKRPLAMAEILDRMVARRLVTPTGKTPMASLSATLYRNVAKPGPLRRVAKPGPSRARNGSVRWTVT
jgi:hypothetical protein